MIYFQKIKLLYTRRVNTGVGGMITLVWILKKQAERAYIGLIWLRIEKSGGLS
jgi:hypothetical protein